MIPQLPVRARMTTIKQWDVDIGQRKATIKGPSEWMKSVAFNVDRQRPCRWGRKSRVGGR